jgi:hypothetical protein
MIDVKILSPQESGMPCWVCCVEGRWVEAADADAAKTLAEQFRFCARVGYRAAQMDMRKAIGLHPFGDHVPR